jgi:biotin/methionine sulfoxide reductase
MISNQPVLRLHSQNDSSRFSRDAKVRGREVLRMHPDDARARSIVDGDIVRVFNDRGACLAAVRISTALRKGVVQLPTGAWFDPLDPAVDGSLEKHGNPNVLTRDRGTSRLGQGPTAHSCLVEIERFDGELPPVTAFDPPTFLRFV